MKGLKHEHKHILKLIDRDKDAEGWTKVSEGLFPVLSGAIPSELVEFEDTGFGGRARLTAEGQNVFKAMTWL